VKNWDLEKNLDSVFEVTPGSGKKRYWLCPSGHSILRSARKVIERGLCCSTKTDGTQRRSTTLRKGENDLRTLHSSLVGQWSPVETSKPEEYLPNSSKRVFWRCPEFGHDYKMSVANKTKGQGCPICSNQRVRAGFNDLATTRPELLAEWHPDKNAGIETSGIFGNSNQKYWWSFRFIHFDRHTIV
jgi:hypothetical protein